MEYMELKLGNASFKLSDHTFVDRVFCCLLEDGVEIKYGDYISKVYKSGFIKVAKSLGLYKTTGRAELKRVFIHPKLMMIINTTVADPEVVAKTIIGLVNGDVPPSFGSIDLTEYHNLANGMAPRKMGDFGTYILKNEDTGQFKIGKSKNPYRRCQSVRLEMGESRIAIIAICMDNFEAELHFHYREKRVVGEWFSLDEKDVSEIIAKHSFIDLRNIFEYD